MKLIPAYFNIRHVGMLNLDHYIAASKLGHQLSVDSNNLKAKLSEISLFQNQGRRKYLKRGSTTIQEHLFLKQKGQFLKIKRALLCLLQNLGGHVPPVPTPLIGHVFIPLLFHCINRVIESDQNIPWTRHFKIPTMLCTIPDCGTRQTPYYNFKQTPYYNFKLSLQQSKRRKRRMLLISILLQS